ncbi:hypothetical protein [Cribrihabitans neustonicus]|uniref:hypothetical protein n=1 Tax=Cribrihabitans neustonicus TaxID=1429085 RepID=UPI003B5ABD7C
MPGERSPPLRERMIDNMRIRGTDDKAQKAHIRAMKHFATFLGHRFRHLAVAANGRNGGLRRSI